MGAVARDRGHAQAELWWRNGLAKNLFRLGQVAEAAALLEGSPVLRTLGVDRADAILGLGFLAIVRWRLGRRDEAVHAAEDGPEPDRAGPADRQLQPRRATPAPPRSC